MSRRVDPGEAEASGAGGGCAEAAVSGSPARPAARAIGVLAGFREPVVLVLLAIAFFTYISGKPLDGVLMVIVAAGLAWDAGRRAREGGGAGRAVAAPELSTGRVRPGGRRRLLNITGMLAGGAVFAGVVGSFIRYSWPATAGIIGLGTIVVITGWHGPLRNRPVAGRLPLAGALVWAVVLVFGCLWELAALLLQPAITTGSYAHPTISTLTDPLLGTWPGRSVLLAGWLAFGWYLAER